METLRTVAEKLLKLFHIRSSLWVTLILEQSISSLSLLRMWRDPGVSADSFYEIRPECTDVPVTRFKIKAGKTLSARKWHAAFTPEGYLDIGKTLSRIYRGGVHPSIKGEVWEFLLGCYDPKSTFEERYQIRQRRRMQYATWKEECRQLFPLVGSGRFVTAPVITEDGQPIQDPLVLKETSPAKGLAVHPQHNNSPSSMDAANNLEKVTDKAVVQWMLTLHQIGMCDICSPMIILLDDEADAFWCFERLMRRLRGNFRCTESSVGVAAQLSNLASVTQFSVNVCETESANVLSLNFGAQNILVEMMWALEYDPELFLMYEMPLSASEKAEGSKGKTKSIRQCGKYEREIVKSGAKNAEAPLPMSIFLVASVLKDKSAKLLQEARGLDDVVKILNDTTGNIDAKKACSGAMKLHKKYLKKVFSATLPHFPYLSRKSKLHDS
ncbi:hypothetical protein JHK85_038338 [Glycine max]|nr:hypothetical protein JHK85_038338 [Glycine max]